MSLREGNLRQFTLDLHRVIFTHRVLFFTDRVLFFTSGFSFLTRHLLKRETLRLGDKQSEEATQKHEEGVDFHDVVLPWAGGGTSRTWCGASDAEGCDGSLGNDGTDLAGGGRDAMRGAPVACGEALTGDDEGRSVGPCVV